MGPDLTDKRWIVAKGILFAVLAVFAGVLQLLADIPVRQKTVLLVICVWASCRFYYFLFHCLQAYVDPGLKSAGVMDLLGKLYHGGLIKLPAIKRAEEVEQVSEGWPSFSEARANKLRRMCGRVAIFLTLVAAALPIVGIELIIKRFSTVVPIQLYMKVLGQQLLAPVLLLLLEGLICYCAYTQKRIPAWIVLLGWIGAFGLVWNGGEVAHDFSHELFGSCTGYSEFNFWLAASIALSVIMVWLLEFRVLRGRHVIFQLSKTRPRILILLSIPVCWVAALYFLELL